MLVRVGVGGLTEKMGLEMSHLYYTIRLILWLTGADRLTARSDRTPPVRTPHIYSLNIYSIAMKLNTCHLVYCINILQSFF
jgi:hypothetical protein